MKEQAFAQLADSTTNPKAPSHALTLPAPKPNIAASLNVGSGPLSKAASLFTSLGSTVAGAATTVGTAITVFRSLGDSVAGFVSKANPGAAERWERSWEDTAAGLGQKLTPVLDGMTVASRALGDALLSVVPNLDGVGKALKKLFDKNDQGAMETDNDYTMRKLAAEKYGVQPGQIRRRNIFSEFTGEQYAHGLLDKGFAGAKAFTAEGAAARPASFSSIASIGMKAQAAAFGSGGGSPAEETNRKLDKTNDLLQKLVEQDTDYSGGGGDFGDGLSRGVEGSY